MPIDSVCPGCGKGLRVGDEHAGKQARCPECSHIYVVPSIAPSTDAIESPSSPMTAAESPSVETQQQADQYWMQTADGNVYGPQDRKTLDRWFAEGRVGENYKIRVGENGEWQVAEAFRPQASQHTQASASNANNPYSASPTTSATYSKADQSTTILVLGILSILCCPITGIPAWTMANQQLKDIDAGKINPNTRQTTVVGKWIGIIGLILGFASIVLSFAFAAIGIVLDA